MRKSRQYQIVEYYIVNTAIPKKLGRVVYDGRSTQIRDLIKRHGLTPIPLEQYRKMQAERTGRTWKPWGVI